MPPFRPGAGWLILWLFVVALGGLITYLAFESLRTGVPMKRADTSDTGPALVMLVGLFLVSVPVWHLPQVRKEAPAMAKFPRISVMPFGVWINGKTDKFSDHALPWEAIRGFRIQTRWGRQTLAADLVPAGSGLSGTPGTPKPAAARTITRIRCIEPYGSAYVLNYLLEHPALRQELGSVRSGTVVNSVLATAVASAGRQPV